MNTCIWYHRILNAGLTWFIHWTEIHLFMQNVNAAIVIMKICYLLQNFINHKLVTSQNTIIFQSNIQLWLLSIYSNGSDFQNSVTYIGICKMWRDWTEAHFVSANAIYLQNYQLQLLPANRCRFFIREENHKEFIQSTWVLVQIQICKWE